MLTSFLLLALTSCRVFVYSNHNTFGIKVVSLNNKISEIFLRIASCNDDIYKQRELTKWRFAEREAWRQDRWEQTKKLRIKSRRTPRKTPALWCGSAGRSCWCTPTAPWSATKILSIFSKRFRLSCYYSCGATWNCIIKCVQQRVSRRLPNKHEIYDVGGKKPYKLCMRRRHSVFAVKIRPSQRSFFADRVLQAIV
jgi:hypothetical protein